MKTLLFFSVLLINTVAFGQSGQTFEMSKNDHCFNLHNELLNVLFENNVLTGHLDNPLILSREILDFWRLDSMITFNIIEETDSIAFNKNILTYNNVNNTLEYVFIQKLPDDEEWQNKSKSVLIFNDENLQIQSIMFQGDQQEWIKRDKRDYVYNDENKVILNTRYYWDIDDEIWLNSHKVEYQFDGQGFNNRIIHYSTDNETNNWRNFYKYEITYNDIGKEVEKTTLFWDIGNNIWNNTNMQTFSYEDGVESSIRYDWDSIEWKVVSKDVGYRIDPFTEAHDGYTYLDDSIWLHNKKAEYRYDDAGNNIFQESYNFSVTNSLWVGHRKFNVVYNESGQYLRRINYDWRTESGGWVIAYKDQLGYNEQGLSDYYCTYGWIENRWVKNWSVVSYFSNISSINESDINNVPIRVYPNPCTNQLTFVFDNKDKSNAIYQIYTLTGSIVDEGTIESNNTIDVDKLDVGYYFIKLEVGSKRYSGKFLKL